MNEYSMCDSPVNEGGREVAQVPGSGLATAAFIMGIISVATLGWGGPVMIIAIICGAVGRSKYPKYTSEYKKSHYGMIMGIIGWVLGFLQGIILGIIMVVAPIMFAYSL